MAHKHYSPQRREDYILHERTRKERHIQRKQARRGKNSETGRRA